MAGGPLTIEQRLERLVAPLVHHPGRQHQKKRLIAADALPSYDDFLSLFDVHVGVQAEVEEADIVSRPR